MFDPLGQDSERAGGTNMLNYRTTRSQLQKDRKAPTRPPVTAHLAAAAKNKPIIPEIQVIA